MPDLATATGGAGQRLPHGEARGLRTEVGAEQRRREVAAAEQLAAIPRSSATGTRGTRASAITWTRAVLQANAGPRSERSQANGPSFPARSLNPAGTRAPVEPSRLGVRPFEYVCVRDGSGDVVRGDPGCPVLPLSECPTARFHSAGYAAAGTASKPDRPCAHIEEDHLHDGFPVDVPALIRQDDAIGNANAIGSLVPWSQAVGVRDASVVGAGTPRNRRSAAPISARALAPDRITSTAGSDVWIWPRHGRCRASTPAAASASAYAAPSSLSGSNSHVTTRAGGRADRSRARSGDALGCRRSVESA